MGKMISGLFGNNGDDDAAKATAAAARSQQEADAAAANMKANFATDLKQENTGTVVSGGTADAISAATSEDLLKKKKSAGLSSQLGLNA